METKQAFDQIFEQIVERAAKQATEQVMNNLAEERDAEEAEAEALDAEGVEADVADASDKEEAYAYHIVNTNRRYDPKAYEYMLDNKRASAFWDKKQLIYSIKEGDRIFLYHSGRGIVAYGTAGSPVAGLEENTPYGVEEAYVELSKFKNISDNPLTYKEICDAAVDYRPAVVSTRARVRRSAGDKIWDALKSRHEK